MVASTRSASGRPTSRTLAASVRAVLLDVEGTTTPIDFVYQTLFPYARKNLERYLQSQGRAADLQKFRALMHDDDKSMELKELQGKIWAEGYDAGHLVGQVFDDVPQALQRWHSRGIDAGIFSSGSVLAQQLLFRYSAAGDLTPLIRWHFDTNVGGKKGPDSYRRIAADMQVPPQTVLFVSDIVAELDAARHAGMRTALSMRPGNADQPSGHGHPRIHSLSELDL
jgi:enolase-phosphatase E1